jgi:hypothetical protein
MYFARRSFAQPTELCELPQRRVIMAARPPESCAPVGGKQPIDEAAIAQPPEGPIDLFHRNILHG